jgi:hypothetical protein
MASDSGGAVRFGRAATASDGIHSSSTGERLEHRKVGISAGMSCAASTASPRCLLLARMRLDEGVERSASTGDGGAP